MTQFFSLYSEFQETLRSENIHHLDSFKEPAFWDSLTEDEKFKLSRLFFRKGEELLQQGEFREFEEIEKELEEVFSCAEHLVPLRVEMLCQQANVLYHFGMLYQNTRCFLHALERLLKAESKDPDFFQTFYEWSRLWGNILVSLGKFFEDEALIEKSLDKFSFSERILKKEGFSSFLAQDLYWDWAEGWVALGKCSGEVIDFQKAIEKFQEARKFGCDLAHFRIDYGEALLLWGTSTGNPEPLRQACDLFKEAISATTFFDKETTPNRSANQRGWTLLTKARRKIAEMTGSEADYEAADQFFHEAILAIPKQGELWLEWAKLDLYYGWTQKNVHIIEKAFEKLTSSKIPECDPFKVSLLLVEGLILLGLFLEDFKLLKESEERLSEIDQAISDHSGIFYLKGLSSLAWGIYYSEEKYFPLAIEHFQNALRENPFHPKFWESLFQAYVTWGFQFDKSWVVQKGLGAMARLVELRPFSSSYLCHWGNALIRFYQMNKEICHIEEAILKFEKAIRLQPESPDLNWLFYYGCALDLLGDYYGEEDDFEKAIDLLSLVSDKLPNEFVVKYHLAVALSHYGELVGDAEKLYQAHDLFQKIIRGNEEDETVWCEWGYALLVLSELVDDPLHFEENHRLKSLAEEKLLKAIKLGNGIAFYYLSCLYSLTGLYDAALRTLTQAENAFALPSIEELEQEEWLEGLRQTEPFQEFLHLLKSRLDTYPP